MRDPRSCCHTSLQKAEVTWTFCEIFLPNLCGQGCQDAYKERHCAIPNWHNTKTNVNKSLLEKGRILIISHYLGMPCQLAEPNPGTFSASLHLWDAVRGKQRDRPGFQIHSTLQFTWNAPRPAMGPVRFTDLRLEPANLKGSRAEVTEENIKNWSRNIWGANLRKKGLLIQKVLWNRYL